MLVILTDNQILSTQNICQSCLMADQSGQPRWRQGKLQCGRAVRDYGEQQPNQYECQMGFRVVAVD